MQELFSLINGFHPEELKIIKSSFRKINVDADSLLIEELFIAITTSNGKILSDKELSFVIYKVEKLAAIAKLKSRLFHFILEILCSDAVLSKEILFDNSDRQIIRIRKKMIQFRVLFRKKRQVDASILYHLLSEIIKEAKENEQYDVLIECLNFKKAMLLILNGFSEIKQIEKQIDLYNYTHNATIKTSNYYIELIANQDLLPFTKFNKSEKGLLDTINEIKEYVKYTGSNAIKYIYKLFQLNELQKHGKHLECLDLCLDILNLLKSNKHLNRNERVGTVYGNISICNTYRKNFDDSIADAKKAQEYFDPTGFNFMILKEQEFCACFYGRSYNRANAIISELLKYPIINKGEFRHDKYLFFEALTCFKLGNQKSALTICNQALEITKDKSRWDLGIRYLRLMCMIELLQYDQAYDAIDALRKTMKRNVKDSFLLRDELVYRAFNEFASTGFSDIPTNKLIEIIDDLSSSDSVNAWNYYTHELIPIHKWINSQIKTQIKVKVSKVV